MKWPPPYHHGRVERLAMRLLFAAVVALHLPESLAQVEVTDPSGLARLVDLRPFTDPIVWLVCRYIFWLALISYVLRFAWSVALPLLALLSVIAGSLLNSQGAIGHRLQLVTLVLCAQAAAQLYTAFRTPRGRDRAAVEERMIWWSQQTLVATYLVSGLTKLIRTGGMWPWRSPLVAVQIVKTNDQEYYNRLEPVYYNAGTAVAEWMAANPFLAACFLTTGLLIELTAPAALWSRRLAAIYGIALLAMHAAISRVMKLEFRYHEYLLWIYFVNVPFWLRVGWEWLRATRGRLTR